LYAELTGAQLRLSQQMIAYWGAFVRDGSPAAALQPPWPAYGSRLLMSLRPGGQSRDIPAAAFAAEHDCGFWNTTGRAAEGVPAAGPAAASARSLPAGPNTAGWHW
jgi:carboxylesterase type B